MIWQFIETIWREVDMALPCIIAVWIGRWFSKVRWEEDAVENGVGEWYRTPAGRRKFRWIKPQNEKEGAQ